MSENKSGLDRTLGLAMLTFYGVGMILGAGIYSIIGKAAGVSGDTLWISFALAAFVALLTALSYAELSTMFPKAGAEFVYLTHAFKKKWLAGTAGVAMAFSGAATATTVSLAFSGYLNQFTPVSTAWTAALVLAVFTGIAILGVKASSWTNVIFTLIEIGGLGLILFLGFKSEKFADTLAVMPHAGTLAGAALIVFSYFGFENIVSLAEEAKEPEKHLPWAILLSLAISTVLYLAVAVASLALMSPEELSQSDAALMSAAQKSSPTAARILGAIALFSTANTALISIVGASRILYGMASARALPQMLGQTLSKRKTPWLASLAIFIISLSLIPLGKIETVASVSSLATMLVFALVNLAIIRLRVSDGTRTRPFRVPLSLGKVPVPAALGVLLSVIFLFQFRGPVYMVGGLFLLSTMGIFYFIGRRADRG